MPGAANLSTSASLASFAAGDEDVLLTRPEAAAFLRLSVPTLERWTMLGIGPRTIRIGPKGRRYPLGGLREYVRLGEAA